jgi:hypothetical protein
MNEWCSCTSATVNNHGLTYFEADAGKQSAAVASVAAVVPSHYAAGPRISHILNRLGKAEAAAYVAAKMPTDPKSRSGDAGEILASSFVTGFTPYTIGVLKLRWKDHREMAMRGDDILAVCPDPALKIKFLKGEVKSRTNLAKKTVDEARKALAASHGRPTPHALSFFSDRLFETGKTALSDLIDDQLKGRITTTQMFHLMFMFTGNNPSKLLADNLTAYAGKISQHAVGLRVTNHQAFIKQIFEKATADGIKS